MEALWIKLQATGMIPKARSSHSLTVVGKKAFMFGGEHEPRKPIDNKLHAYDLEKNEWSEVHTHGAAPCPRIACATAAVQGCVLVFGGRTGITMGEGALNDLHSFDLESSTWSQLNTKCPPAPRSFHTTTSVGTKFFVFGGCSDKGRLNDLHCYDTKLGEWEEMPCSEAILGRGGSCITALGGAIYVTAGFSGKEMNDMHRFDIATRTWSQLSMARPIPPRSVFGCVPVGEHHLIAFGGEVDPSDQGHEGAGEFSNETFVFNTQNPTEGWTKVSVKGQVPPPRGWFAAAGLPNGMLVFGGNSPSNARLADLYRLEIEGLA
ncbi:nitrile-specifier protein 5 [Lingula anatina]|uniref:Nitrile-specifier protein 5 n=1 Tax=Lingula anatina TaxID=7574 RepID=A0A1S3HE19_LINAN|nr:nitrile-specifier protein 5 [Lingula anatina]|eukprot:XP_013384298.1 nitrile-specifier protein 5 [Lingula anatina]